MIIGIYDDDGEILGGHECICKYGNLQELYCVYDGHRGFYKAKVPTVTALLAAFYRCPREVYYAYNLEVYQYYKNLYYRIRGRLMHDRLLREMPVHGQLFYSWVRVDARHYPLVGIIDAYDPCTATLYEGKTSGKLGLKVTPVEQGWLYSWLLQDIGFKVDNIRVLIMTYYDYEWHNIDPRPYEEYRERVAELIRLCREYMLTEKDDFRKIVDWEVPDYIIPYLEPAEQKERRLEPRKWACGYCDYYRYCEVGMEYLTSEEYKRVKKFREWVGAPSVAVGDTIITREELLGY